MNKCIYELFDCRSLFFFFDLPFYLVLSRLETETTNVVSVCVCVCVSTRINVKQLIYSRLRYTST